MVCTRVLFECLCVQTSNLFIVTVFIIFYLQFDISSIVFPFFCFLIKGKTLMRVLQHQRNWFQIVP